MPKTLKSHSSAPCGVPFAVTFPSRRHQPNRPWPRNGEATDPLPERDRARPAPPSARRSCGRTEASAPCDRLSSARPGRHVPRPQPISRQTPRIAIDFPRRPIRDPCPLSTRLNLNHYMNRYFNDTVRLSRRSGYSRNLNIPGKRVSYPMANTRPNSRCGSFKCQD